MAIFQVVGFSGNIFWLCSNTFSPASKKSWAAIQIRCGHSFSIQHFLKNSLFSGIRHTVGLGISDKKFIPRKTE
jgi:hypothetical protein